MNDLVITLRDINKEFDNYDLNYKIKDNALGSAWKNHFIKNFIESDHPIEKTYCLHGWQSEWESTYPRNLNFLCDRLNYYISVVNKEMPTRGYPKIDLNFTVEALQNSNTQDELMNKVHHHFELLIGQSWNHSKWWKLDLKHETKFAIRMLNNFCHEIEFSIKQITSKNNNASIFLSQNGINKDGYYIGEHKVSTELILDEYKDFVSERPFGSIMLYYAQLGKSHAEAYIDNDSDIDHENISGIRYVTGEGTITFNESRGMLNDPNFVTWLKENNFDKDDPALALNNGVVAELQYDNKEILIQELLKRNDVYKFSIDGLERTYNYTWKDQESWEQKIKESNL